MSSITVNPFSNWIPHAKQIEVMKAVEKNIVMNCGRRGGKTNVGARKFFDRILEDIENGKGLPYKPPKNLKKMKKPKPRLEYWCISPTYSMSEIQQEELSQVIPEEMIENWDASKNRVWLKGHILIAFKSADRPKTLVGKGLDGVWLDEASKMKSETWTGYLSYALADKDGWSIWTTTPEGMNWFYYDIVLQGNFIPAGGHKDEYVADADWRNFYWTSKDNPLPKLQKNIEKMIKTMPKRYVDREINARFDVFFGQVYEEFSRDTHLVSRKEVNEKFANGEFVLVEAGKDWGFKHPGVTLVGGITKNAELWIIDCLYKTEMEILIPGGEDCWIAQDKKLMKKWKISKFYCDSAEPSTIKTYRTNGLPAVAALKHIKEGIRAVSSCFTIKEDNNRPNIFIAEDLKEVIEEIGNYRYPEDATGQKAEIPIDDNNHAMDSLRYLVWNSKVFKQYLIKRFKVIPWKAVDVA